MIWLIILIPLLAIIGIILFIDKKNNMGNLEEKIDRNQNRDQSIAQLERYKDINQNKGS